LPRAPDDAALLRIITSGIPGTEMPKFELASDENRQLIAWVRHLGEIPPEPLPGDPRRGESVYRDKGNCALCHQMHGYGGALGPDLTDVGRRRSIAYLRTALLDPGAAVPQSLNLPQNFLMVTAVFPDRSELTGVRINEDTFSIQIRDFAGQIHSYYKSELADLQKEWGKSPMPSFSAALTPPELNDLIAFLAMQKGQP
jgi:putative heme-binding domain-containing protein